jgi:hypothetical protein
MNARPSRANAEDLDHGSQIAHFPSLLSEPVGSNGTPA